MSSPFVDSLERYVRETALRLQASDHLDATFHDAMQGSLCTLGRRLGYTPARRCRVQLSRTHHGEIDVAWLDGPIVKLVVEINYMAKVSSLKKLDRVQAENKLWVCYGPSSRLERVVNEVRPTTAIKVVDVSVRQKAEVAN